MRYEQLESPVGPLRLAADERGLREIRFAAEPAGAGEVASAPPRDSGAAARDHLRAARAQLAAYFAGELRRFELALAPRGTPFQLEVWSALAAIPYGETISYAELAGRVARPRAVRAVGAANGANPLPIVLPCHRVIGSDGRLVGYGGGLERKRALLDLERGGVLF